jgi:hypothetical protein
MTRKSGVQLPGTGKSDGPRLCPELEALSIPSWRKSSLKRRGLYGARRPGPYAYLGNAHLQEYHLIWINVWSSQARCGYGGCGGRYG